MSDKDIDCVLCDKTLKEGARVPTWAYGNNAWPLSDGQCCDNCNDTKVIPARLKQMKSDRAYGEIA